MTFHFRPRYTGVYQDRRRECGFQLYSAVGVPRGDKAGYAEQTLQNSLPGAPHVAILTSDPDLGVYGAVDVAAKTTGAVARHAGPWRRSHPSGAALARYSGLVKRLVAIPADRRMVCAMSFGYEDEAHPANSYRTTRASLDEAVTWVDR